MKTAKEISNYIELGEITTLMIVISITLIAAIIIGALWCRLLTKK